MTAETARQFQALEAQAQKIMAVFTAAGYEAVAPAIIQPAKAYLDVIGEELRARTYVFTDPEGAELCLRPDLTVPTCRLHLERHGRNNLPAKYCYNGSAFRFQPARRDGIHPREFRQAGLESFAAGVPEEADSEVLILILKALDAAGLSRTTIRIGDLGLFHGLLDALDVAERWRDRLREHFWRPEAFQAELTRLSADPASGLAGLPGDVLAAASPIDRAKTERALLAHLETHGIEMLGTRTLDDVVERLCGALIDAATTPIAPPAARLIADYLAIAGPARAAGARIADLASCANLDLKPALSLYERRLKRFEKAGLDLGRIEFRAGFGRNLEYYTGFVFEVTAPSLASAAPVAGGGRYDDLMREIEGGHSVPAVGAMIHTERLLRACQES